MSIHRFPIAVLFLLVGSIFAQGQQSNDALAHAQKAEAAGKSKQFGEALTQIKKAIELEPTNHLYLAMASDFSMKAGEFAAGLAFAKKAIALDDTVGAYYVLAAANAFQGQDLETAREYCNLVVKRGASELGQGPYNDAKYILSKLVPTTYTFYFQLRPRNGKAVRNTYIVALPKGETDRQQRTYEIGDVRSHRVVKGKNNDALFFVPKSPDEIPLTVQVVVTPQSHKKALAKAAPGQLSTDVKQFLLPTKTIDPRSPALVAVASKLQGKTQEETVRNILAWMKKNIEYKLDNDSIFELDFKSMEEILQRGHAECRGYSMLFTALCRTAGIPSRTVWGLARVAPGQDQRFGDIASHNWSEVYISGVGWVPVDPQDPQTFGFLPSRFIQFQVDAIVNPGEKEMFPLMNLLHMHNGDLRFDAKQ